MLDLSYNQLRELPKEILQLRNLVKLSLSYNQMRKLPREIWQLRNLSQLSLINNQLEELPGEIGQLRKLSQLDLMNNQLKTLPGEIGQLRKLSQLDLKNNQLKELPEEIGQLRKLRFLNLNFNQLKELPRGISQLENLSQLYLMNNQISKLPEEIAHLGNLSQLDMKNNLLKTLPEDFTRLENLTFLNLSFNQLEELPQDFTQLKNLIYLHVSSNQLRELPRKISRLKYLFYFDISSNQVSKLPKKIVHLEKLKRFDIDGNPLAFPPVEIVGQGLSAIKDYLKKMDQGGQTLYEGKLLILGQGGVGKTCLMKRLTRNKYTEGEGTTEGIDIHPWEIVAHDSSKTRMTLNIWDFGGQEIYHATHQFFLTQRSLYILVWDARQEEEYGRIDYWLKTIETFAEHSPILIVMNKADERVKYLNFKDLKQRCPQLVVSGRVSAKKGTGIAALRQLIRKEAWKLPLMGTFWPPSWLTVRRTLETDIRYQMPYQEYLKLCKQYEIEKSEAGTLSRYLHDLGIILHFQDDSLLKHTIILKPEWGTDAVYKVLDARPVQERKGVLYNTDLPKVWTDRTLYPEDKYATILRLMANFELAFPVDSGDRYIVAELLSEREAEYDWNPHEPLQFEYHYEFLPAGVITRLIVRMHEILIERDGEKLCWREGAYFKYKNSQALLRINPYVKMAIIQVQGQEKQEFLKLIRHHFASLHKTIRKIRFKEKIPCLCSVDCEHRFDYNFLLKCEEKGKFSQTCHVSVEEVDIRELLDRVEKREIRETRLREKLEDQYPAETGPSPPSPSKNKKWYLKILPVKKRDRHGQKS